MVLVIVKTIVGKIELKNMNLHMYINHDLPHAGQGYYPGQGYAYPPPAQQQTTTNVAVSSVCTGYHSQLSSFV